VCVCVCERERERERERAIDGYGFAGDLAPESDKNPKMPPRARVQDIMSPKRRFVDILALSAWLPPPPRCLFFCLVPSLLFCW